MWDRRPRLSSLGIRYKPTAEGGCHTLPPDKGD